jgi:hypothetical protein
MKEIAEKKRGVKQRSRASYMHRDFVTFVEFGRAAAAVAAAATKQTINGFDKRDSEKDRTCFNAARECSSDSCDLDPQLNNRRI